ncbi:hypothetical protein D3C81_2117810 [compost metagenome]
MQLFEQCFIAFFDTNAILFWRQRFIQQLVGVRLFGHIIFRYHFVDDHSVQTFCFEVGQGEHIVREFGNTGEFSFNRTGSQRVGSGG